MNRRLFLNKFSKAAAATGSMAVGVGAAMKSKAKETSESDAILGLQNELKNATKKIRDLETRHRRVTKALVSVALMSTGLDAIAWVKGDFFG